MTKRNRRKLAAGIKRCKRSPDATISPSMVPASVGIRKSDGQLKGTYYGYSRPLEIVTNGSGGSMRGKRVLSNTNYIIPVEPT